MAFTKRGVEASTILTYGQSTDPTSRTSAVTARGRPAAGTVSGWSERPEPWGWEQSSRSRSSRSRRSVPVTAMGSRTSGTPSSPTVSVPATEPGSPSASPSGVGGPALLLPNVRSLGAGNLQIELFGQQRRLRFSASLANLGPGPLLVRPRGGSECARRQMPAVQVLHRDTNEDGAFQRKRDRAVERREVGCMLDHPTHDHWHFDAMAAYSLRRAGSEEVLVSRDKVSFCLRDNERVPNLPVAVRREHFGECTRNGQQGISPGWVDIYKADLDGQWLRLPRGLGPQVLCLDLEADPLDRLVETDEADNATSVGIRIVGTNVRRVAPRACA